MSIPNITPSPKNLTTVMVKNRNKNKKVTNWGSRQGSAKWKNDQGSQKGSVPGKPNSLRTSTSKKVSNNIRGIGSIFN